MLTKAAAIEVVRGDLMQAYLHERDRLELIDQWYRWKHPRPTLPKRITPELRHLVDLSRTPWLGLVVTTVAQAMSVDNYRSEVDTAGPWYTWNANKFPVRQTAVHRAALAYGYAFVTVLPGEENNGRRTSVMRGVSPRRMVARYGDPAEDDWPMYAMKVHVQPDKAMLLRLYEDDVVHHLGTDASGSAVEYISYDVHDAGVCPVVRYANMLDLEGRADGEVEPFISVAARVNKTTYDRLLTQHYSSWKVRTIAGLAEPTTEEEANRKKLQLRQDDILVAEDADTKFGTLDETPLTGFLEAERADLESLAAVTQTPAHNLTGQLINLSAEALAAARAALTQKVAERRTSFGSSHVQALQLAAALEGDEGAANDVHARVTWQDMEVRSIAQAVDALGKAATMLGIPVEALWARIPGVEKADVDEWLRMRAAADPLAQMHAELLRQAATTQPAPAPALA